jgi:hypothetical protein
MKPEVKTKLVEALRGDEYKQTFGRLKSDITNCFCVMGVLCDIYVKEVKAEWYDVVPDNCSVPKEVQLWAGFEDDSGPKVTIDGRNDWLMAFNDTDGKSFNEMADAIEAQL